MPAPNDRVRVLVVHGMAERGGSDQALVRMVRTLPPDGFDVTVVVPAPHPLAAELQGAGARLVVVPVRRISTSHGGAEWLRYALAWPGVVLRLAVLVLSRRADVVVTNSLHFWHAWAAALLTRRPHVWLAREVVVQSGAALRLERWLTRHFATVVVAASRAIADQLDPPLITVVHEHPDPAEFTPALAGRWRDRVGLPDDVPLLAVLGRFDTWKGFDVALDALPLVRAALPGAVLVLAGDAVEGKQGYADSLHARAASTDGARWVGHRGDVPELLADADLLLVPSTEPEPYGLVAVEALASGCPVVASDAGGPVEILAAAEPGAGRLVPPGDARALAAAAVEVLADRAPDAASRRHRRVLSRPVRAPYPDLLRAVAAGGRRYRGPVPGPDAPTS